MPARSKHSRRRVRNRSARSTGVSRRLLFPLILLSILLIVVFVRVSALWDGKSKLTIVVREGNGNVKVTTFDPETSEIFNIIIPGDTEVELSRKLGRTRIKNAWQIGANAGYSGVVLAETVKRNFKFPVYVWADSDADGFSQTNIASVISAAITPYKTNLRLADRVRLALFAISVKNVEREDFDLAETSYLKESPLIDGKVGYKITSNFPQNLLVVFVNTNLTKDASAVIVDESGDNKLSSIVAEVLQVEGAKVVQIAKYDEKDYDCEVTGTNKALVKKIAKVFSCIEGSGENNVNSDLYIKLGKKFTSRF